jgi:long-chain acyl-CoA synthetase
MMSERLPKTLPDVLTLPGLLRRNAQKFSERIAIREKERGIWKEITWKEYLANVRAFALGLLEIGVRKGDTISIISDNRPEWLYAELAAQAIGAIPLSHFPESEDLEELHYLLEFSDTQYVFAEDQEQTDKVLVLKDRLPKLKGILVKDFEELWRYNDPLLMKYEEVRAKGQRRHEQEPHLFEALILEIKPDDVAILCTTSGTTSRPKVSMLTHRNIIISVSDMEEMDPTSPDDNLMSFLPPGWLGERIYSMGWALSFPFIVNIPEEPSTVLQDMREIGPTIMFWPTRMWEKAIADIQIKIMDTDFLKRTVFNICMAIGDRYSSRELQTEKEKNGYLLGFLYWMANVLVFRKLRDHLGMSRLRTVYSGGAPISHEIFKFFRSIGVKIRQAYGSTENTTFVTAHPPNDVRLETVGCVLTSKEVKISESGEILVKGPTLFKGYYRNPEATAKIMKDGWFHTGDYGSLQEGHLILVDRIDDLMKLADGSLFAPQYIENKLKFSPYIREAVAIGHKRDFVSIVIQIDMNTLKKWAEDKRLAFTTFAGLSQKPEVYELIKKDIQRVNKGLPPAAQIKKYALFKKELDAEDDELTQTQKIRRRAIEEKYKNLIGGLYDPGSEGKTVDGMRVRSMDTP